MMDSNEPIYQNPDFVKNRPDKILKLAERMTPIMNKLHDLQHDQQFWLHILGDYLKTCVNREVLMSDKNFNPVKLFLPVNSWLAPTKKQVVKSKLEYLGRRIKYGVSKNAVFKLIENHNNICLGGRANEMSKQGVGHPIPPHFPLKPLLPGNLQVRKNLNGLANKEGDIFFANTLRQLPVFYTEGFKYLYDSIILYKPEQKIFHFEHLLSPYEELLIAKYQASGASIWAYQTGGFMGELHNHPNQVFYERIDRLITYGWQQHPKDYPGKPYRLLEYSRNWQLVREKIQEPDFDCLVVFSSIVEQTKDHYKYFSDYFLQHIDRNRFTRILYRPRPVIKYLNNSKELSYLELPADIAVDNGRQSMAASAARAKLVIETWLPSTNLLECIHAQQPVVAINTNKNPSDILNPFIKELERLKIVHQTTESLVLHLNNVNIEMWWKQVLEDKRFIEFRRLFAGG